MPLKSLHFVPLERYSLPKESGPFGLSRLKSMSSPMEIINILLPDELLLSCVISPFNHRLDGPKAEHRRAKSKEKDLTINEFKKYLGIHLLSDPTADLVKETAKSYMTLERFFYIDEHLQPNLEEVAHQLSNLFSSVWQPGLWLVADEFIISDHSEKAIEDGVLRFIEGKPHPNGLLNYEISCRSSKSGLPFLLQLRPWFNLSHTPTSCTVSMASSVKSFFPEFQFVVIGDSAFGNKADMGLLKEQGIFSFLSWSGSDLHPLKEIGAHDLNVHETRFFERKGEVAIVHHNTEEAFMYVTNTLRSSAKEEGSMLNDSLATELNRCSKELCDYLATRLGIADATMSK